MTSQFRRCGDSDLDTEVSKWGLNFVVVEIGTWILRSQSDISISPWSRLGLGYYPVFKKFKHRKYFNNIYFYCNILFKF